MSTTATLTTARRVAEARWALNAALESAADLEPDVAIGAGRLEQALDLVRDVEADLEQALDPDERPPRPWRRSAAGYTTPPDVVVAVERILELAGGMLVHPGNTDRDLSSRLERLAEEVERQRRHPLAFEADLLVHHALAIALELTLRDAGSDDHLRAYGLEPDADDER